MPRIEHRLAALERRTAVASFDPVAVCRVAAECYQHDLPLPANLTPRERSLAEEMRRFLTLSAPERWWSDLPPPLPPVSP